MNRFFLLKIFFFSVALCSYVVTSACAETDPSTVRAGFTSVLSGPWAAWGSSGRDGVLLASQSSSNHILIDYQDDQCDSKHALSNIRKFLLGTPPEFLIVGCMEVLEAIAPVAKRHGLPIFALGFVTDNILNQHSNIFALNGYADLEARYIAPYLKSLGSVKSLAIIHGSNQPGELMGKRVEEEVNRHEIKVTSRNAIPVDTIDFKAIIARISKSKSDAVWVHQSESSLLTFIRQLREAGYKKQIFTLFSLECDTTRKGAGSFLEGVKYTYQSGSNSKEKGYVTFQKDFIETFGYEPNENAAIAYDALGIIDKAVTKCKGKKLACYHQFFRSNRDFEGIAGKLTVTKNRGALRPYGIKEYRKGKFVWVVKNVEL